MNLASLWKVGELICVYFFFFFIPADVSFQRGTITRNESQISVKSTSSIELGFMFSKSEVKYPPKSNTTTCSSVGKNKKCSSYDSVPALDFKIVIFFVVIFFFEEWAHQFMGCRPDFRRWFQLHFGPSGEVLLREPPRWRGQPGAHQTGAAAAGDVGWAL